MLHSNGVISPLPTPLTSTPEDINLSISARLFLEIALHSDINPGSEKKNSGGFPPTLTLPQAVRKKTLNRANRNRIT
jgi:hypothetical protein